MNSYHHHHHEPNTSLDLSLSSRMINVGLVLDPNNNNHSSPINATNPSSPPSSPIEPRVFSCNYCRRKFYSSQALGGHQNAHKLERTLAKKSRELSSLVRPHSGPNRPAQDPSSGQAHGPAVGIEYHHGHSGRFGRREIVGYGTTHNFFESGHVHEDHELSQLDLSLRL